MRIALRRCWLRSIRDAKVTVAHCRNLDSGDYAKLCALYKAYDKKGGEVSDVDLKPLESKRILLKDSIRRLLERRIQGKDRL